ncbi:hypothetical protein VKT23_013953 [Stygiomarasmius scandens]|uniref:Uncharacterized protein n=1 Tax=Marasmiellus scandens TaxID=2682957 RepID=A0ABR1J696_9AGAR
MAAGDPISTGTAKIVGPVVAVLILIGLLISVYLLRRYKVSSRLGSQSPRRKHSATHIQPYPLDVKEPKGSKSSAGVHGTPEIDSNRPDTHRLYATGPKSPSLNDALPISAPPDEASLYHDAILPIHALPDDTHSRRSSSSESATRSQATSRQIRLREAIEVRQQSSLLLQQASTSENEICELRAHIQRLEAQLAFSWIGGSANDPPPSYMTE